MAEEKGLVRLKNATAAVNHPMTSVIYRQNKQVSFTIPKMSQ